MRVEAAGLFHSDLSVADGSRVGPVPMLLRHEASGLVVQVGAGVQDVRQGRVVMTFLLRCNESRPVRVTVLFPCAGQRSEQRRDPSGWRPPAQPIRHHLGLSGFATHSVVDRRPVVAVDSDVPAEVAAVLGCAVLTGGGPDVNFGRPLPGQRVIMICLGGVGMAAVLIAAEFADVDVLGTDPVGVKRDAAV
jgi:alcohol dehydrogenase